MTSRLRLLVPTVGALLLVAACGGDDEATPAPTEPPTPPPTAVPTATPATSPVAVEAAPNTAANVDGLTIVEAYEDYVWLAFTPDDAAMALHGSKLALQDRASGEIEVLVEEVLDQNYATAISPDGRYILYVTQNEDGAPVSRVWDAEAGEVAAELAPANAGAVFLSSSTDLIVSGSRLEWLDLTTGELVEHELTRRSTPEVIELMPDGSTLVTAGFGRIFFDSTETYEELKAWDFSETVDGTSHAPSIPGVSPSADGTVVAVGVMSETHPELNAIHLMDYAAGEVVSTIAYELTGSRPALRGIALSPDGSLLAAAFQEDLLSDGRLDIFDVESGELISSVDGEGSVQRVRFSPDGTLLAAGTTQRDGLQLYGMTE